MGKKKFGWKLHIFMTKKTPFSNENCLNVVVPRELLLLLFLFLFSSFQKPWTLSLKLYPFKLVFINNFWVTFTCSNSMVLATCFCLFLCFRLQISYGFWILIFLKTFLFLHTFDDMRCLTFRLQKYEIKEFYITFSHVV